MLHSGYHYGFLIDPIDHRLIYYELNKKTKRLFKKQ